MKPTRCTLLPSIFISASLHVSGSYVPIIGRIYCIYATLVFFHSVWVAALGVDGWIILGGISRRWNVGLWTGLGWPRIETGVGSL